MIKQAKRVLHPRTRASDSIRNITDFDQFLKTLGAEEGLSRDAQQRLKSAASSLCVNYYTDRVERLAQHEQDRSNSEQASRISG